MGGSVVSDIGSYLTTGPFAIWKNLKLEALLNSLVGLAVISAVVICFAFLIVGGIRWITSGDDKEALIGARKTIIAALIGIILVFSVWAIMSLVRHFFGISTSGGVGGPAGPGP